MILTHMILLQMFFDPNTSVGTPVTVPQAGWVKVSVGDVDRWFRVTLAL